MVATLKPEVPFDERSPVSQQSDWIDICTAPAVKDATPVTNPNTIGRDEQNWLEVDGTQVLFRLKYKLGISLTTSPKIQPFGRDSQEQPERLKDKAGVHLLELTVDTTNDASDGTFRYTESVAVDALGNKEIFAAVNVAFDADDTADATIQAKPI